MDGYGELGELVDRICADHPDDPWPALVDTGLARVGVPEAAGGTGGELADAAAVVGALAANAAPAPVAEQSLLAGWLAARAGFRLPDGLVAVAWDQAQPDALRATGGPRWTVDGQVPRVPWGRAADHLVAVAPVGDGGVLVALIPAAAPAVTVQPGQNLAGEPRDRVALAGAPAGPAAVLPAEVLEQLSLRAGLARTLQIAGALPRLLALTLRYAAERHQFGRPLARLDPVRQQVALLAGEVAATATAADAVLAALAPAEPGPGAGLAVAAARTQAGTAATTAARIAHQVHGAIGVTQEHPLHRYTTRLWSWRDEFGSVEHWARRTFAAVHAPGAADPWSVLTGAVAS